MIMHETSMQDETLCFVHVRIPHCTLLDCQFYSDSCILLFPHTISLWNNLPNSVVIPLAHSSTPYPCTIVHKLISFCWMYARICFLLPMHPLLFCKIHKNKKILTVCVTIVLVHYKLLPTLISLATRYVLCSCTGIQSIQTLPHIRKRGSGVLSNFSCHVGQGHSQI